MILSSKKNKTETKLIIDLTLSELIEKYGGKYYMNIEFKQNGNVSIWISDKVCKEEGEKDERK